MDALGRPTTKQCACGATLGRTAKLCAACGHQFVGKQWRKRKAQREALGLPSIARRPRATVEPTLPPPVDDFDCDALIDGRLRIYLQGREFLLSSRQREILAIELRMAT